MTLRSKLLATVAVPMLSAVMIVEPALASAASRSSGVRVEADPSGVQLAQATVTCSDGSQAEDQSTCDAIDAQKATEAEAQKSAEEEAARQAEQEAQRQAEEEAQRQAAEQEAARQAEEEAARQAEEEAARQAEQQAQQQADEEAARQAAEQEAARQAEQQAAEEAQRQAEEEAAQQAEQEAQQQTEQPAEEAVTCADGSQAASADACPTDQAQPQAQPQQEQQAEEPAAQPEQPAQQAEEPAADDQESEQEQQAEEPAVAPEQPAEQAEQPPVEDELRPAQNADEAVTPTGEPSEQQAGDEPAPGGEQVLVPAVEPPAEQSVPEIVDTRTEEEKQQIAEDPSTTSETVVLPVEGGAAVLDSDKDADNSGEADIRDTRTQQREEVEATPPPESDAAAQADAPPIEPEVIQKAVSEEGTRLDAEPEFEVPTTVVNNVTNVTNVTNNVTNNTNTTNVVNQVTEVRVLEQVDNRTVINVGDRVVVRHDDRPRLRHDAQDTYYEELPRGRVRETIERGDGSRLVTVYNRFGDIIVRSRFTPRGEEYVLFYSPEADGERPRMYLDVGDSLPPMRLTVPVSDYIVTMSDEPDRDYYDFLARPPVERVERVYSMDEVRSSARLRDKVRRIDLDTITFASGSAEVSLSQAKTLRGVAGAMEKILERDPGEVFLIEGHTDAVGSDQSNLVLSDERAETVANLLTEVYGIPPENMSTQGYGERYLKIRTQGDEERNRRVTIRRVTPLVKPVAAR